MTDKLNDEKVITRYVPKETFTVSLFATGEDYGIDGLTPIQTVYVTPAEDDPKAGRYDFDAITYKSAGTHHYVIVENDTDVNGYGYDDKVYQIKVDATDSGNGEWRRGD